MVRQALYVGRVEDAMTYVGLTDMFAGSVSATTRAMLCVVNARAFATLGHLAETMRAIEDAETWFAQRNPEADPPALWFYDDAQILGDTGHALWTLGMRYKHAAPEAEERLSEAVAMHAQSDTRGRMLSAAKLLRLRFQWDPRPEVVGQISVALDGLISVRSARIHDDLRALSSALKRVPDVPGTLALGEVITNRDDELMEPSFS